MVQFAGYRFSDCLGILSMQTLKKIEVRQYEGLRLPYRIAVGDLIRCHAFANCFLLKSAIHALSGKLWVCKESGAHIEYRERDGQGSFNMEAARGVATYLVDQIKMTVGDGPHDIFPNQYRMTRVVSCLRVNDDFCLPQNKEEICFSLNEPMSLFGVDEGEIELLGYAQLPLVWEA